jgi:ribosomal protein S18 acetylase RimI-like enzyme
MSKRVARNITPQLWHSLGDYGDVVIEVRRLLPSDVDAVVERVEQRLDDDARINRLVNPSLDRGLLAQSLASATSATWVALEDDQVAGHLYGAVLESSSYGRGAWTGPDGSSHDSTDVLADLYAQSGQSWFDQGALDHYVWTLDHPSRTGPWHELGFARMHQRGVLELTSRAARRLPPQYRLRPGSLADLEVGLELLGEIDRAQARGPSFAVNPSRANDRADLEETLADPEVDLLLVECDGDAVAQLITYPLPAQRGSFERTAYLSAVAVREAHRGRGVASALVDAALAAARANGFDHAETSWRVTNREAARFWRSYGFTPTYVRLHRRIGAN